MNYGIIVSTLILMISMQMKGSNPTWSSNIANIVYSNCSSCHRDGGIAPFSLMSYEEVASKKNSIVNAITTRSMPPYPADTKFRSYSHQRTLLDADINAVIEWVNNDVPVGDIASAPKPPTFASGPIIKNPSFTAQMPIYTTQAKAGGNDEYRCFVLEGSPNKDEYISAIEVVPGNPEIVHHVLVFQDTSSVPMQLDAQSPGPGYPGFGGVGSNTADLIGVYVPGIEPYFFPKGFGVRFQKGARIIVQVHYPAGTEGKQDNTSVRLTFAESPATREVFISPLLNRRNIVDGPLRLPAGQSKTFTQKLTIPYDATAFAVMPHMHLLGESIEINLQDGKDTIPIISIPHWDFHWQMAYTFKTLQKVPKGSVLQSKVTYNNSIDNPHNPSSPPKEVSWGEGTTDEMMLTYFYYTAYQPGDELITTDIDENTDNQIDSQEVSFIEVDDGVIVRFADAIHVNSLQIYDVLGSMVYEHQSDHNHSTLPIPITASGAYYLHATDVDGKVYRGGFCIRQ